MCGIAGGWWPTPEYVAERLPQALRLLQHRGPDDHGYQTYRIHDASVGLGHTRLSIIDLSAAGHQPMHSADGRWAIVFNGEIYNYRELRDELRPLGHHFVSDSDTEVLLAAWAQWGAAALPRLTGMFAFALLDKERGQLTCARDAFGIKPFFYAADRPGFVFASELPALLRLLPGKPELNWQRVYDYLVHGDYDSTPGTFYAGVQHLPAGHWLQVDAASGQVGMLQRWWTPNIVERTDLSFASATERVRAQFLHDIRLHLRSDVPLGAALSGGIDSSAVVCAMRHIAPDLPINTFSYIARDSAVSEEIWVDRVNQHTGATGHKVVVSGEELARDLEDMIVAQGEPFGSTSIYAQYRVFQLAKEHGVTVTLDGQGADELFAGYNGYPGQRLRSLLEQGQLGAAWRFLDAWSRWPGRSRLEGIKRALGEMTQGVVYDRLRRLNGMDTVPAWIAPEFLRERDVVLQHPRSRRLAGNRGRRVVSELAAALTQRGLPALLRHGDRNSMRFSVESRVPFLTLEMAELALSLPESYLISAQGESKHIFRAAMRGIVPDDILDRRDKIGFATPERDWLVAMGATARHWLSEDLGLDFLDQAEILRQFDRVMAGQASFSWQVWRWINFCVWYRSV